MYEQFYGFDQRPFTLLPDPDFLFLSETHRGVLEPLERALNAAVGLCVVSGEIGAGKTTLIRELLNRLQASASVGLVSNTHPAFGDILQWVAVAFGLDCQGHDTGAMQHRVVEFARSERAGGRQVVLIVDEAQNLALQAFEALRLLGNPDSGGAPALQIILVGQPQLREKLADRRLAPFVQNVAFDGHLERLDAVQTQAYIRHRLAHAGGDDTLFTETACDAIYRATLGVPRLINRTCDLALVYGYAAQSACIDSELVDAVVDGQHLESLSGKRVPVDTMPVSQEPERKPVVLAFGERLSAQRERAPVSMPTQPEACAREAVEKTFTEPPGGHSQSQSASTREPRSVPAIVWLLAGVAVLVTLGSWLVS